MISKKQIELMEQYANVRRVMDSLKKKEQELKEQIIPTLEKSVTSSHGIFTPVTRTTYKYSSKLIKKESEAKKELTEFKDKLFSPLEKLKKIEELDGTAQAIETTTMSFRSTKNN